MCVCGGGADDAEPPLPTSESQEGEMMDDEQGSTNKVHIINHHLSSIHISRGGSISLVLAGTTYGGCYLCHPSRYGAHDGPSGLCMSS